LGSPDLMTGNSGGNRVIDRPFGLADGDGLPFIEVGIDQLETQQHREAANLLAQLRLAEIGLEKLHKTEAAPQIGSVALSEQPRDIAA